MKRAIKSTGIYKELMDIIVGEDFISDAHFAEVQLLPGMVSVDPRASPAA